jgi:hypothetical protein
MREHLYTFVIKQRRPPGYYLPIALDEHFITQITSEHLIKRKLPDGRTEDVWTTIVDPHLGDCEKYAEVLGHVIEPSVLLRLRGLQDDQRARLLVKLAA